MYLSRTPTLVQWLFRGLVWRLPTATNTVFLTFDDGPNPEVTPWVLDQLQDFNAKATFFCVGSNVQKHPELMERTLEAGHAIGNHTFDHADAWKTKAKDYLTSVYRCDEVLTSTLFRPPYGKLTPNLVQPISKTHRIIMWDVLSADFDEKLTGGECAQNVIKHTRTGSIIVFHDSTKAWPRLKEALPLVLEHLNKQGLVCASLAAG